MSTISTSTLGVVNPRLGDPNAALHKRVTVRPDPLIRSLALALTGSILLLIFVGGLVKSHEAGLSVPDWPTTFGENMFLFPYEKWVGGIFYEHGHRLMASGVGFLTLCLAAVTFYREKRSLPRVLSALAVLAVILQGVLGGLTVLYGLPPAISICHGLLAQTFLCIAIALAYLQSEAYCQNQSDRDGPTVLASSSERSAIQFLAFAVVVVVYLQLFAGALMRHNGAGMALLDFPTMGGSWLPSLSPGTIDHANQLRAAAGLPLIGEFQVALHLIHRVGGFLVTVAVCLLIVKVAGRQLRGTVTQQAGFALFGLTIVQFLLGALSVVTVREPTLTSLHVAVGAAVLGVAFFLLLSTFRLQRAS